MPDNTEVKATKHKNKIDVPKTDVSLRDDEFTRRFVFWMITLMVMIIIVGGAVLYWLIGEYVKQSNKNKSQDITISLLEKKKKDIELLKPNYDKIISKDSTTGKSDADLIFSAMPRDLGYSELIAMFEKMGAESGVKISTISKSGEDQQTTAPSPSSYEVTVSMEGEFSKILEFLLKTEKSARVLDFVSMNLSGSTRSGRVTASTAFRAYYQTPADISPTEQELK
jgi:Tfp pilus assembly protein PilO